MAARVRSSALCALVPEHIPLPARDKVLTLEGTRAGPNAPERTVEDLVTSHYLARVAHRALSDAVEAVVHGAKRGIRLTTDEIYRVVSFRTAVSAYSSRRLRVARAA